MNTNLSGATKVFQDIQKIRISLGNKSWAAECGRGRAIPGIYDDMRLQLKTMEDTLTKEVKAIVKDEIIWTEWLSKIKGVGPLLAAKLISLIGDISRFDTIAKFWRFAGQGIRTDGSADRKVKGEVPCYSSLLKTTVYNVGCSFLKTSSPYRKVYENKKRYYQITRQDQRISAATGDSIDFIQGNRLNEKLWKTYLFNAITEATKLKEEDETIQIPWTDKHVHLASLRVMNKIFLSNLWEKWRQLEGLPVRDGYAFEYLNHTTKYEPDEFAS